MQNLNLLPTALVLLCLTTAHAFSTFKSIHQPSIHQNVQHATSTCTPFSLSMVATATTDEEVNQYAEDDVQDDLTSKGLLKRDRYVATNRFAVRPGKEAKFEARWANRKSRLATLPGFKYFHLMRRVTLNKESNTSTYDMGTSSDGTTQGNYVSFTIWNKKSHFSAWRKGDAFKEAHGGTSLFAFVSTLVSSARTLQGAPRPAFYDGLLQQSIVPESTPMTVDGWRDLEADGEAILPTECFVACNQFYVPSENAAAFEQRWKSRESTLKECDGFVSFSMLRRDGQAKGHGVKPVEDGEPTYLSTTIWRDREAFLNWTKSRNFQQAHGSAKKDGESGAEEKKEEVKPPQPLWSKPPVPVFYEGTLVISSADGA